MDKRKEFVGKLDAVNDATKTIQHANTTLTIDRDGEVSF